jgi:hypothetical protein
MDKENKKTNKDFLLKKKDRENRNSVMEALQLYFSNKEKQNFFSDSTKLFVDILYDYIDIINNKYKKENTYSFYHIVALAEFEKKELLFMIFNKYSPLNKKMFIFTPYIKEESELFSTKILLNMLGSVFSELADIKKYNLSFAMKDIHNLITEEIQSFFLEGEKEERLLVSSFISEIIRTKSLNEGTKNKYKELINKLK